MGDGMATFVPSGHTISGGSVLKRLRARRVCGQRPGRMARVGVVRMSFVDPWSVSSTTIASQLFAFSLAPYIAFLRSLGSEETKCPKMALNGFKFLLVFVFASIPAGIYAKVAYNDILANVDWLHGGAESFLTITNLLILIGLKSELDTDLSSTNVLRGPLLTVSAVTAFAAVASQLGLDIGAPHAQPGNALSTVTWVIHISSLIEWLGAMDLVWERAAITGNERWKVRRKATRNMY